MQGRPSTYTEEIGDRICSEIADGKSLKKICAPDDMPDKATVYRWMRVHDSFRDNYTRAKEDQADALFDEIMAVADDLEEAPSSEKVQAARVRIDAMKWAAGKLKPKKYGDKQHVTHAGDPDAPLRNTEEASADQLESIARRNAQKPEEKLAN